MPLPFDSTGHRQEKIQRSSHGDLSQAVHTYTCIYKYIDRYIHIYNEKHKLTYGNIKKLAKFQKMLTKS